MTSPLLEDEHLAPPLPISDEPDETDTRRPWARLGEQIRAPFSSRRIEPEPPTPSGYLTLIPLSDARLQPRSTRLTAAFLIAFALLIATIVSTIVFLSVPRSVSVGEISVSADRMSWNTTKASYQLRLVATIPVFNPNYLRASIEGELKVLFYMAEAGRSVFEPVPLSPRALPKLVDIDINASDVPSDYILSILSQCSTFPEVLVFFLKGKLRARYLWQYQHLATIDTYFMISCRDGGTVPSTEKNETAILDAVRMAKMNGLGLEGGGDQRSGGGDQSGGGGRIELPVRLNKFM